MSYDLLFSALTLCTFLLGSFFWNRTRIRGAHDVLSDLDTDRSVQNNERSPKIRKANCKKSKNAAFYCLVGAGAGFCTSLLFLRANPQGFVVLSIMGAALGYLLSNRKKGKGQISVRDVEYFLPVVMERIVMAVEAGLDVLPAIHSVVELEIGKVDSAQGRRRALLKCDPVTQLLSRVYDLSDSGLAFDAALEEVAGEVDCSSLRHAFIHLAVAYREGGEIVLPLRELSDSTQLYYQESVEEEIARLPVKATMPLILTFAGLIICFLTTPIIQIVSLTSKAIPQ